MIRILIVDDHVFSREALAFLLDHQEDMEVTAQVSSMGEALEHIECSDVAIVDLYLPDGNGIELIRKIHSVSQSAHSLLLTAKNDLVTFARALEAGADGALHKSASINDIIVAVRKANNGEAIHTPKEIMDMLHYAGRYRESHQQMQNLMNLLTPRERELLQAIADGLNDHEISEKLSISVRTVQTHVANILGKLGVESRLQALVHAARFGVVVIRDN